MPQVPLGPVNGRDQGPVAPTAVVQEIVRRWRGMVHSLKSFADPFRIALVTLDRRLTGVHLPSHIEDMSSLPVTLGYLVALNVESGGDWSPEEQVFFQL